LARVPVRSLGTTIKIMPGVMVVSVEEYLSTPYRPDCDFVDGQVRGRNVGEYPHSRLQGRLVIWFGTRERDWKIRVLPEQRVRVSARRFRIPDVCVVRRDLPIEPIFTQPPLICIEVLSKDDSLHSLQERVDDYLASGVPNVWILEPVLRKGYICTQSGFNEPGDGILRVAESRIHVPLAEVFAEMDQ